MRKRGFILAMASLCLGLVTEVSAASSCDAATGRVLSVGPGRAFAVPSAAAAVARDGNVVKIAAGDYRGDVATWRASGLRICGEGPRARLIADGELAQGKAIWVIAGADVTIEGIDFHDARGPHRNGAGIRAEGPGLTVKDSGFFDNENGILSGAGGTITIERCEFARNGHGDGYSHNIYIGRADRLLVSASYFHEARVGHNLKSRAKETRIEHSYFMDGPEGTSSYLVDFPEGGVVHLRGNLFHKGPKAENSIAIAYGQEGLGRWTVNTFEMENNAVVITRSGGFFIAAPASTQSLRLRANLFAGTDRPGLVTGGFLLADIEQRDNVIAAARHLRGVDDIDAPAFWP